jgi:hypothetical protein
MTRDLRELRQGGPRDENESLRPLSFAGLALALFGAMLL